MTKQYIAFLQTTQKPTYSPFRTTDKLVCMVTAANVRVAKARLKKLMQAEYDNDTEFRENQSVSLLRLVEVSKFPEGIVLQHEVMVEQPTLVDGTIKNGVRNVRLQEKDRMVWTAA